MNDFSTTLAPRNARHTAPRRRCPSLTVIAHPDTNRVGNRALLLGLDRQRGVNLSRRAPDLTTPGALIGQPLDDPFISREPIMLEPVGTDKLRLRMGQSRTTVSVNGEPVHDEVVLARTALVSGIVLVLAERVVLLLHESEPDAPMCRLRHGLVGDGSGIEHLRHEINRVADLETPVLLRGETGTGKELVARAIHEAAGKRGPFVSVNLGAIPPNLAASELFGAMKGSFTGADRQQTGYFRQAEGGTLFLDEVGEAPPEVQVMLLRALESGEIHPVGAQAPVRVRTRVLAATDADLESKMARESFKTPLFHRLAGYEIRLPALRDRREDFGRLFFHFARAELAECGALERLTLENPRDEPWLPADLASALIDFPWPGNIRQLRNVVRQLVIGCRDSPRLTMVPLVEELLDEAPEADRRAAQTRRQARKPANLNDEEVVAALKRSGWDVKAAAAALGISRGSLYLLMEKIPGLVKASDLTRAEIEPVLQRCGDDIEDAALVLAVSARALRRRMTKLGMH